MMAYVNGILVRQNVSEKTGTAYLKMVDLDSGESFEFSVPSPIDEKIIESKTPRQYEIVNLGVMNGRNGLYLRSDGLQVVKNSQ